MRSPHQKETVIQRYQFQYEAAPSGHFRNRGFGKLSAHHLQHGTQPLVVNIEPPKDGLAVE
jgi:hypothetical protein